MNKEVKASPSAGMERVQLLLDDLYAVTLGFSDEDTLSATLRLPITVQLHALSVVAVICAQAR